MITCDEMYDVFNENDLTFFTGVPDSTFKDWMTYLVDHDGDKLHNIISSNECEAIAIAAGYHLATGKIGVVYMQNSGEGKTINPLVSLCDPEVYSIPLIMLIGWRGEPGKKDEPQHAIMGKITIPLLNTLNIEYEVLSEEQVDLSSVIHKMKTIAQMGNKPVAIIVKKGFMAKYESKTQNEYKYEMNREEAIKTIVDNLKGDEIIVSTTGKTSRELFEYRVSRNEPTRDFYTVGSMGCSSSIAHSIALFNERQVLVLDGDGAAIMQAGALATIGHYKPKNLIHIIFDNGSYESTGRQPTVSNTLDFEKLAHAFGYKDSSTISTQLDLKTIVSKLESTEGPFLMVVKVNPESRKDLGRPTTTPIENKQTFMDWVKRP
jgi:phosphonopyruvate decarboxylase